METLKKPLIIAEVGANHRGDMSLALEIIKAAGDAGADAVKFQLYDPNLMAPEDMVLQTGPWKGRNARELYREAMTSRDWFPVLFDAVQQLEMVAFSSVFDIKGLEYLEYLGCPWYKISSFELIDHELIKAVKATGKVIMLSTGMATLGEINEATNLIMSDPAYYGTNKLAVLKCVSGYPAPADEMNLSGLRRILAPAKGLSDHTLGSTAAIAATAMGATVIEKHLTLRRSEGGPDAAFSAEPHEFEHMVRSCKECYEMIGTPTFRPTPSEYSQMPLRGRTIRARES